MMACPLCGVPGAPAHYQEPQRDYWRCANCDLVFLSPEQRLDFDGEVARYRLHRNSDQDPAYLRFLSRLATPVIERVPPGATGLDFGCGPATALALLLSRSGRPTASYDPVFHPDERLLHARYDFVTCSEVLEHVHEPLPLLRRLGELITPGGTLGVMTQLYDQGTAFAKWHYRRDPTHVCFYHENTMRWIAAYFHWTLALPAPNVAVFTLGAHGGIG